MTTQSQSQERSGCRSAILGLWVIFAAGLAVLAFYGMFRGKPLHALGELLEILAMLPAGAACLVVGARWKSDRAARTVLRVAQRAREIEPGLEPGESAYVVGRVVGGARCTTERAATQVAPAQEVVHVAATIRDGPAGAPQGDVKTVYSGHLVVEDGQQRLIRVGDSGGGDVLETFEAGAPVFALGEIAAPSTADPYRETQVLATLVTGSRYPLWVGGGDRVASLLGLREQLRTLVKVVLGLAGAAAALELGAVAILGPPAVGDARFLISGCCAVGMVATAVIMSVVRSADTPPDVARSVPSRSFPTTPNR